MSGSIKWIFVVLLSTFLTKNAFSQVLRGCRSGGSIYRTSPSGIFGWTGPISETCPLNATTATHYTLFIQNASGHSTCPIGLLSLGGTGTLVDYRLLNCPIDGSIVTLLLPIAVIGFMVIKRS